MSTRPFSYGTDQQFIEPAAGSYEAPLGLIAGFAFEGLFEELAQDNIIAHIGGGQASATQITGQTARVSTVTNPADSVYLPPAIPGLEMLIINHGANDMQVFGATAAQGGAAGGDTIDDVANATGVSQMANSMVIYSCAGAGKWYSNGIATGFATSLGLQTLSSQDGITAHSTGGQANAFPLAKMQNRISVVGAAGDSVLLPPAIRGMQIVVLNGAAVNSMNVFPSSQAQGGVSGGDSINALGANAAFAAAAGTVTIFYCVTNGQWWTK